jgi:hypothetical protein
MISHSHFLPSFFFCSVSVSGRDAVTFANLFVTFAEPFANAIDELFASCSTFSAAAFSAFCFSRHFLARIAAGVPEPSASSVTNCRPLQLFVDL